MRGFPCTGRNKTRRKKIIDQVLFKIGTAEDQVYGEFLLEDQTTENTE